ncbi:MAG: S-layer homology domain-containing protein [Thermoleophilia bacterium]
MGTPRTLAVQTIALALLLVLVSFTGYALAADRWTDITDARWVSDYGVTAADVATVADGYPDLTFRPYQSVTRGQFSKMAVNGLGVETMDPPVPTFKDVPRPHIFYTQIEGAASAALVGGYADGSYRPDNLVTRQQTNTILARYLSGAEVATSGFIRGVVRTYPSLASWYEAEGVFYLAGYSDKAQLLEAHAPGSAYLVYREVVKGSNGRLNPGAPLTRAQAAVLVLRTAEAVGEVTTPPAAPTALATIPPSPSRDARPFVTGKTIPDGRVAVYDTFASATVEVGQVTADAQGNFSVRVPSLLEGSHSFTAKVKDSLGLISTSSTPAVYLYDATAPTGAITAPLAGSAGGSRKPAFTATAEDAGSGVASVAFQYRAAGSAGSFVLISTDTVPQAGVFAAEWGDINLPDGAFEFRVVMTDVAGNAVTLAPISVIVDLQIPTVELQAPLSDGMFFATSRSPLFAATADDLPTGPGIAPSGVARVDFLYQTFATLAADPGDWEAADFILLSSDDSAGYSADWGTLALADGRYVFAVQSVDAAGNRSALDWQDVVVDNAAPVVAITAPLAGATLMGGSTYNITWTATDTYLRADPLPIKIEYSADNGDNWSVVVAATENDGTYSWTVPSVNLTTAKIRVTAADGMTPPNVTTVTTGAFTIDSTPPAAPMGVGATDEDINPDLDGRDFSATWTVSTSDDVVKQRIYILPTPTDLVLTGVGAHTPLATFANKTTASWQGTAAMLVDSAGAAFDPLKAYRVWIVAEDAAGHLVASAPATWPADPPAAPTGVDAGDPDLEFEGIDGRDFKVWWTASVSPDVLTHHIYILPSATALVLSGPGAHDPVAVVTVSPWVGPQSLTVDSAGDPLAAVEYTVYVVATDDDGRTAQNSATMTPTSETP